MNNFNFLFEQGLHAFICGKNLLYYNQLKSFIIVCVDDFILLIVILYSLILFYKYRIENCVKIGIRRIYEKIFI